MSFAKHTNGLQHLGIPTKDIKKTIEFYEGLGFEIAYKTGFNGEPNQAPVAFLKLDNLVIETYQDGPVAECPGAVDHYCIDVDDIEAVYQLALEKGYKITTNGIEFLPFWDNGVKFFKIEGPNLESIEFGQML